MKQLIPVILGILMAIPAVGQRDTSLFRRVKPDTVGLKLNMDAVYTRPFVQYGKLPAMIGGYVEANSSYFATNGVSEGLSFQIPRLTIFVASSIWERIKFMSEIELEEGGREINIEFASVDFEFHPLLNLRGGVVMNPIGSFNQNHDGPKWEFISRPISSTTIIPSTWSNVGFGLFGKQATKNWVYAYEAYVTNGFDERIIANAEGRTWLPASKENGERFEESFNGVPMVTLKAAIRHRKLGELGVSWMGGIYNRFQDDGLVLDKKRRIDLFAVDFNTVIKAFGTYLNGEWCMAVLDVSKFYSPQFGRRQQGAFLDIVQPVLRRRIFGWSNAVLNVACRGDFADYNAGRFNETGANISDHVIAIVPAISLRPSAQTVLRVNYRYEWHSDLLGNLPSKTAGFQFGFSTYF